MTKQPVKSQGWCQFTDRQGCVLEQLAVGGQGNLGASAIPLWAGPGVRVAGGGTWGPGMVLTHEWEGLGLGVTVCGVHS